MPHLVILQFLRGRQIPGIARLSFRHTPAPTRDRR